MRLSVVEVVLDGPGQHHLLDHPRLDPLSAHCLADRQACQGAKGERSTFEPVDVPHRDLAVAPHRADHHVDLLALKTTVGRAKVMAVDDERKGALVHVEHHEELVRHLERLVRCQRGWIGGPRLVAAVVVRLVPPKVPTPRLVVVAYQTLVADAV